LNEMERRAVLRARDGQAVEHREAV
jgi:hypothetical protein